MHRRSHHHHRRLGPRGAFTLVELLVSMAIMTILLVSLGSVVVMASKAIPPTKPPASDTSAAQVILRSINAELEVAAEVTLATAHTLEFKVADRNSDGAQELIRYSWAGSPGDPLLRTYNAGTPETLLAGAVGVDFSYTSVPATVQTGTTSVTSPEVLFFSNDTAYSTTVTVPTNQWYGQVFSPLLPTNATSWRLTTVKYSMAADTPKNGTSTMQIRPVNSATGLPSAAVYASATRLESTMPSSFSFYSVDVSATPAQAPGVMLCFTIGNTSADSSCQLRIKQTGWSQGGSQLVQMAPLVPVWIPTPEGAMQVQIYGTYAMTVPVTSAVARLTSATIAIQSNNSGPIARLVVNPRGKPVAAGL